MASVVLKWGEGEMTDDTSSEPFKPADKKLTRFAFGTHIYRDGQTVVEVYDGDRLMAAIYSAEHGVKIVSRHFTQEMMPPMEFDPADPPTLHVRFTGSEPVGRERLGNGPIIAKEDGDE